MLCLQIALDGYKMNQVLFDTAITTVFIAGSVPKGKY